MLYKVIIQNINKPEHPWIWYFKTEAEADKIIATESGKPFIGSVQKIRLNDDSELVRIQNLEKRRMEYPPFDECVEALLEEFEGRPEKLLELMMRREDVKDKYPI